MAVSSRTRIECFAHEQIARGVIGDGERITVFAVAELELAFEVGAPKIVRRDACCQWRAVGARSRSTDAFDQAVPMQYGEQQRQTLWIESHRKSLRHRALDRIDERLDLHQQRP